MNPKQFYDKVKEMREAQKRYFRTRSQSALTDSKRLENIIDKEIERVDKILEENKPEEETLF